MARLRQDAARGGGHEVNRAAGSLDFRVSPVNLSMKLVGKAAGWHQSGLSIRCDE
jgi:hypothetical protein